MNVSKKEKHFVLVHGLGHGAWCWYKLTTLLKEQGHKVTALDMAASGVNLEKIEEINTFEEYCKPLLDFMSSLPDFEKVVVVGHSLGGMNIALAMEYFPLKISAAVFLTALMPDTIHQPSFVVDKIWTYGPQEEPSTAVLINRQLMQILYSHSLAQDVELAVALQRPGSLFLTSLAKANNFSNSGYGSVRRVYIICKKDQGITEEFARWMITNSQVPEVKEIEDADHAPMISQPQKLCDCLIEIAHP
ncbi:methylesterase 1-like isoform X2 [Silene latifolia]|uniref:methylesterase 1-like isoform X2 n=1 Tax=Silene latifolia TaxID=37657 RepID=UPI003D76AD64